MEYGELVQAIASRVSDFLAKGNESLPPNGRQPLIILTQTHGDVCHGVLENPEIAAFFKPCCALTEDYASDVDGCAGVVLFELTNDALARIDSGICGTPYTDLLQKALLLGKPVWLPREEIELLGYEETTPYAKMMYEKLRRLMGYGVSVCGCDELAETIRQGPGVSQAVCVKGGAEPCPEETGEDFVCNKRVVTEKDVICARSAKAPRILVGQKTILTDLAREYAKTYNIQIVKS